MSLLWATPSAGPREAGAPVLLLLPGVNNDAHMGYVKHVQAVAARACRHDLSTSTPSLLAHPLYSTPSLQRALSSQCAMAMLAREALTLTLTLTP